jgi:GxxExxY protein
MKTFLHQDITSKIIGSAFDVHNFLGNGFQEVIYQRALSIELESRGVNFIRELEMEIFYKNVVHPIGKRRVDFLVEEKVMVELKAVRKLEDVHIAQTINYLEAYKLELALLFNFGGKSLEFK